MSSYVYRDPIAYDKKTTGKKIWSKGEIHITKIEHEKYPTIQKIIKLIHDFDEKAKHHKCNDADWSTLKDAIGDEMFSTINMIINDRKWMAEHEQKR